jgi:hypothetical protein
LVAKDLAAASLSAAAIEVLAQPTEARRIAAMPIPRCSPGAETGRPKSGRGVQSFMPGF